MSEGIRVKPQVEFLRDVIEAAEKGVLRIPAFQRAFTWRNNQMVELFDSIMRGYPIGSLFVWVTEEDHATGNMIGPLAQPARRPGATVKLVIDGQHRLQTLVGVLLAGADAEPRWQMYFDPDAAQGGQFCHARANGSTEPRWVPASRLLGTLAVIQEGQRLFLLDPEKAPAWIEKLQRVSRAIAEYRLPIIEYTGDLSSSVEVFARLNKGGKALGPDELMSALLYRGSEFRLADHIDELLDIAAAEGFGMIGRTVALRAFLAAADQDIYARDWSTLSEQIRDDRSKALEPALEEAKLGARRAIHFLRELGVPNTRLLPYGMQLVALSAFFGRNDAPSQVQRELLSRMFWVTSFSGWFGPPAQERALVKELRALSQDRSASTLQSVDLDLPALPIPSQLDQRSARVRALLNVMLAEHPRNTKGELLSERAGGIFLTKEARALSRIFARGDKNLLGSPANRVLAVTDAPGIARPWLCEIPEEVRGDVLRGLAIPPEAFVHLENNDSEAFLAARFAYLDCLERKFMRLRGVSPPKEGAQPAPSPIDTGDD